MHKKSQTVKQLAFECGIDEDEALITLWNTGEFNDIDKPSNKIPTRYLKRARQVLGLASRQELKSSQYWMKLLNLDERKFLLLLSKLGFSVDSMPKVMPPNSVSKFKTESWRRGINPITGERQVIDKKIESVAESFVWQSIGHPISQPRFLTKDEIKKIYYTLVEDLANSDDPITPIEVYDNLLSSAAFRPQTAIGTTRKYTTIETLAAALLHSLILDHPFLNGNKRTALVSMLVFMDENGLFPDFDDDEAFKLLMQVAIHRIVEQHSSYRSDREVLAIAEWLCQNTRLIEKGNRIIPWRKLRRILTAYKCDVGQGESGKTNITRQITERKFISTKQITLRTQVHYHDDGRDVPKGTIKKIREDLHLDEKHGVDTVAFYDKDPKKTSDFIVMYRKTLKRLANW